MLVCLQKVQEEGVGERARGKGGGGVRCCGASKFVVGKLYEVLFNLLAEGNATCEIHLVQTRVTMLNLLTAHGKSQPRSRAMGEPSHREIVSRQVPQSSTQMLGQAQLTGQSQKILPGTKTVCIVVDNKISSVCTAGCTGSTTAARLVLQSFIV